MIERLLPLAASEHAADFDRVLAAVHLPMGVQATPGLTVRTWVTPTTTGRWEIGCSQLCGLGHFRMRGAFSVVSAGEWKEWQQREVALIAPRQ